LANERELNKRIRSIKNIGQVTSALAAVSASKASKAQAQVMATRAYAGKAYEILLNLAAQPGVGSSGHPLLQPREQINNTAVILITGDRGLAGSYTVNMVTYAQRFLSAIDTPVQIVAVGRKGRDLMIRHGQEVVAAFEHMQNQPSILDCAPIAQFVIDDYLNGKVDQVFVAYTDFVNLARRVPVVKQLLPLRPADMSDSAAEEYVRHVDTAGVAQRVYSYEPEPSALLDVVVPRFTELQVYQAILEAQASEHSARMVAMNNATDNAAELVDLLVLERNKARQSSITSEILDIVGGAEALR